jgi:hypothetical protein
MVTNQNRPIRIGTEFRNGKLYSFSRGGILVASQWPDMRAWRKTPKGKQWKQVRPELTLKRNDGIITAELSSHRVARRRIFSNLTPIRFRLESNRDWTPERDDPRAFIEPERVEVEMNESDAKLEAEQIAYSQWMARVMEHNHRVHTEYLRPIPQDILEAVLPFSERHWHLLNLVGRCPGSTSLMASTPALAMAVSSLWAFREKPPQRPLRAARSLMGKRQEAIAGWLGFPETRSTVKILRKLPPAQCSVYTLLALRNLFTTHPKILRHVSSLNETVIHLMAGERGRYRLSPGFLEEIIDQQEMDDSDSDASTVQDILWMRERLGESGMICIRSRDQLDRLHDRCVERMGRPDLRRIDRLPFPEPPLPLSPDIELEPLRTESALLEEGKVQRNCVGAYGSLVLRGGVYVYRMFWPERATLSVGLLESGKWGLREIKSIGNGSVSVATVSAVLEWIRFAGSLSFYECDEENVPF